MLVRSAVKQVVANTTTASTTNIIRALPRRLQTTTTTFTPSRPFQTTIQPKTTSTTPSTRNFTQQQRTTKKYSIRQYKSQLQQTRRTFTSEQQPTQPTTTTTTTTPSSTSTHFTPENAERFDASKLDPGSEEAFLIRLEEFKKGNYPKTADPAYWSNFLPRSMDSKNKWEMRHPGTVNKLRHLAEIDSFPQNPDLAGDSIRISLHKQVLQQHAVERQKIIDALEIGQLDVATGVGLTPAEYQKTALRANVAVAPKIAARNRIAREDFYEENKKAGLYKNTWFNRLFNSKEDLLQARPQGKEFDGSESAPTQPRSWMGLLAMLIVSLAGVAYIKYEDTRSYATATVVQYQTNGTLALGGDFENLTDQFGKEANSKQYRGFYPLYYFGFTKCPDICPTELHKMMAALDTIERQDPDLYRFIKPVFITVDPLRDTPAQIAAYAENFHPRMRWLTGSNEALTKAAKEFHIYFSIPDDATPDGDYNVDHSIFFFLMNREGKLLSYYGQNKNSQEIAQAMSAVVKEDLERDQYEAAVNSRKDGRM